MTEYHDDEMFEEMEDDMPQFDKLQEAKPMLYDEAAEEARLANLNFVVSI